MTSSWLAENPPTRWWVTMTSPSCGLSSGTISALALPSTRHCDWATMPSSGELATRSG